MDPGCNCVSWSRDDLAVTFSESSKIVQALPTGSVCASSSRWVFWRDFGDCHAKESNWTREQDPGGLSLITHLAVQDRYGSASRAL